MRKMTTEEFITKSIQVHGNKFIYDKVEYISAWSKVLIGCREHGYFLQAPANHLYGAKCLRCRQERTGKANAMSQEEFINKSITIHGQRYDYSKVIYTGCFVPVEIICKIHGSFFQKPNNHLTSHNCPKCGKGNIANSRRKTPDNFIKDAMNIHGDLYDYSTTEYINSHGKIKILCKIHGVFEQKAYCHLSGQGCPICKYSKGELKIREILQSLRIEYIYEKTFPECKNKRLLSFDFYFEVNNKIFLLEYDGIQHIYGWGKKEKNSLPRIKKNDAIKTKFALDNGFILIRIPHTEFDNIENIIKSAIL